MAFTRQTFGGERILAFLFALIHLFDTSLVSAEQLRYAGNVTVVGLFEIYEPESGRCGSTVVPGSVMAAEAVKWYLKRLNDAGDTKMNIGLQGYKTCRLNSEAAQTSINVLSQLNDGGNTDIQNIIGVVGPEYSSEVEAILPILGAVDDEFKLPMIGFSTTAENLRNVGDQFPNFFRVVPSDQLQVEMMVESMKIMEWNRIAIVYENDLYGQQGMRALTAGAESNDICVAFTASINNANGISIIEIEEISRKMLIGKISFIQGFIFFGITSTANLLLQKINSIGFINVPIGLFSDGINMDMKTFKNQNNLIPKTKGSLVASPTYRAISEFQAHWKAIFTDKAKFVLENETNPWLNDVYADLRPCESGTCEFAPLTDGEFEDSFAFQPLYIQYALIAAHTLAKGFNALYTSKCPPSSAPCDFFDTFRRGDMVDTVKTIRLNFDSDFSIRLESLSGVQMSFEDTGEPNVSDTTPSYQLFNLRHANIDDGPVTLIKIGNFTNGHMVLNTTDVIDYQDGNAAMTWPNVRKGQCGIGKLCEECIPNDLKYAHFHDPGDLYIVGLVPVFDKEGRQECGKIRPYHGYQVVEAIRFALQKFNEPTGIYSSYKPDVKIGTIVINTCNSPAVIQRHVLNLQKHGLRLPNGTVINVENRILGYAGPLGSSVTIAASLVLGNLQKVLISYASTNPSLSDRQVHKYVMRVVSPDNKQANAMAKILEELDVNYIQVLYSEGAYGEGGYSSLVPILKSKRICIIQAIKVSESDSYYEYYEHLRKYPHAQVVIVFLRSHIVPPFMKILTGQMDKGEFIFIGSEAWGKNTALLKDDTKQVLTGSFSVVIEMTQDSELLSHIKKIEPEPFSVNPWSQTYLQSKWQCSYNTSYDKQLTPLCGGNFASVTILDALSTSAYVSALAMLIGSCSFFKSTCGTDATVLCADYLNNPTGLMNTIRNDVRFDLHGTGNAEKVFDPNGDGNVGYAIYNIRKDLDSSLLLRYIKVGQYPLTGEFTFDKTLIASATVSRCPNEQACAGCIDSSTTDDPNGGEDKGYNTAIIALVVLLVISVGVAFILGIIGYRYRKQQQEAQGIYLTPTDDNYSKYEGRPDAVGQSHEPQEESVEVPQSCSASTIAIRQATEITGV